MIIASKRHKSLQDKFVHGKLRKPQEKRKERHQGQKYVKNLKTKRRLQYKESHDLQKIANTPRHHQPRMEVGGHAVSRESPIPIGSPVRQPSQACRPPHMCAWDYLWLMRVCVGVQHSTSQAPSIIPNSPQSFLGGGPYILMRHGLLSPLRGRSVTCLSSCLSLFDHYPVLVKLIIPCTCVIDYFVISS